MHTQPEFYEFVNEHRLDDPSSLRLRFHKDPRPWIGRAICHIECLRKCKGKFRLDGDIDVTPELLVSPLAIEQASSAKVGALHDRLAGEAETVLDMTCGLGMDTFMLARSGRRCVTAIERQPELAAATAENLSALKNVRVLNADSVDFLSCDSSLRFDLVFIDPARRASDGKRVFNIRDCEPDLISLLPLFSQRCKKVMAKLSPMLDVSRTIVELSQLESLHIVEEGNECRELLAILDFESAAKESPVVTVHSDAPEFSFSLEEERGAMPAYAMPNAGMWLYEPSAAMMKAGAFNLLCERFGMRKLHRNTHLYLSENPVEGFPGKGYEIVEVMPFGKQAFKYVGSSYGKGDVATRNLPALSPEELSKRMKIKSGGEHRIYGTTLLDDSKAIIITRKKV